jgi:hypothetical protein
MKLQVLLEKEEEKERNATTIERVKKENYCRE